MKKQIRRGVFETNSSSTHAICISKNAVNEDDLPKHISFTHGEFGWENDEHHDSWIKASYLYEAICGCYDNDKQEKLDRLTEMLKEYNIECDFAPDKDDVYGDGYIDHCYDTVDFVNAVLDDSEKLIRYLFGDSFIVTGNDNGDAYSNRMYVNEGEEVTNYGTFTNYGDFKPEFDNYEIFRKGN